MKPTVFLLAAVALASAFSSCSSSSSGTPVIEEVRETYNGRTFVTRTYLISSSPRETMRVTEQVGY